MVRSEWSRIVCFVNNFDANTGFLRVNRKEQEEIVAVGRLELRAAIRAIGVEWRARGGHTGLVCTRMGSPAGPAVGSSTTGPGSQGWWAKLIIVR